MKVKKVFKYATGDPIPENAVYLYSREEKDDGRTGNFIVYVWHYFLVEAVATEGKKE